MTTTTGLLPACDQNGMKNTRSATIMGSRVSSRKSVLILLLVLLLVGVQDAAAFVGTIVPTSPAQRKYPTHLYQGGNRDEPKTENAVTKASWYAVEAFGKFFGKKKEADGSSVDEDSSAITYSMDEPPSSIKETMMRIKEDNQREYFLSGQVDKLIYDEECEFADPFVSFKGRDRFIENLENLGSFITEYSARPLSYDDQSEENAVVTKFMVKLQLNLPWKPVLAWPWGVRCEIDPETCLIVLHKESWEIDAWEVSQR